MAFLKWLGLDERYDGVSRRFQDVDFDQSRTYKIL